MTSRADAIAPIFLRARKVAELLDIGVSEVYRLANTGALGDKHYVGTGTREWRLRYDAVRAYAESLPTAPREEAS